LPVKSAELFLGLKRDEVNSGLEENFQLISTQKSDLSRITNNISTGFKIENSDANPLFDMQALALNYSFKMITDDGDSSYAINSKFEHRKSAFMGTTVFGGEYEKFRFKVHANYSNDFRLPTPYQLLLSRHYQNELGTDRMMLMENKRNTEFGLELRDKSDSFNWNFAGTFFSNSYDNKFREIQLSGSPVVFLDNYKDAKISGIEGKFDVEFWKNRIRLGGNYSKNLIDDKTAFPFKLESKITADLGYNWEYFSARMVWFKESERTGIIYYPNEGLKEIKLDEFANLDVHVEGSIPVWRTKLFCAFSGRNLLGGELIKEGIAIRDRRFYVTLGIEVK
jgi:outer membrane receptor protein involved in Fe transport